MFNNLFTSKAFFAALFAGAFAFPGLASADLYTELLADVNDQMEVQVAVDEETAVDEENRKRVVELRDAAEQDYDNGQVQPAIDKLEEAKALLDGET